MLICSGKSDVSCSPILSTFSFTTAGFVLLSWQSNQHKSTLVFSVHTFHWCWLNKDESTEIIIIFTFPLSLLWRVSSLPSKCLMIISYHGLHIHITGSLTQDEKKLSKSWIITALSLSHVVLSIVLQGKCRYLRQIYIHYTYYEISLWTNIKCMKKKMVYRQRFPNLLGVFALSILWKFSFRDKSQLYNTKKLITFSISTI